METKTPLTNPLSPQKFSTFKSKESKRHAISEEYIDIISPITLKILHLEDLPSDAELVKILLKRTNIKYTILVVDSKVDYIKALKVFEPDIILADHKLPAFDSLEALKITRKKDKKIPFILVTGAVSEQYADR